MNLIKRALAGLAFAGLLTLPALAQPLSGDWSGMWRTLDNGERDLVYLHLRQEGDKLSGRVTTIGHIWTVTGTVKSGKIEIFVSPRDTKPGFTGDVDGANLRLTRGGQTFVVTPVKPTDDYPAYEHLAVPALRSLPANGLAKTPPMGWNSWNLFNSRIDDQTVREMADAMVASGMRDAGYVYLNIDDTWEGVRDANGNLGSNKKFPDMKALADYVHAKGLKFGIYSSPGPRTCAEYPGSYGHEQQDADTFAAWGVDFLKYDWCGARMIYQDPDLRGVYQKMGEALAKTGKPIMYSLCEYGNGDVQTWGALVGANLWRTTGDIRDSWDSMIANIERQAPTAPYAGPGHWNDPDMLEIGNGHMTTDEYRTHMSLWAVTAAPLLAGNDIRKMTPEIREILMNREIIAVDQDALGKQAVPVKKGDLETWVKPLADGSVAVAVVNLGSAPAETVIRQTEILAGSAKVSARDLWSHQKVEFSGGQYTSMVQPHATVMLRVAPKN